MRKRRSIFVRSFIWILAFSGRITSWPNITWRVTSLLKHLRCEEIAISLAPWYAPIVGLYAGLLMRAGRMDEGEKLVRDLRPGEAYGASAGLALFHTCQGHVDLAVDWFEKAIEERNSLVVVVLQSAIGEQLRASPRWARLAAMMNLASG